MTHTVEKIGGTSMSRVDELRDTLFVGDRTDDALYGRVFVVSAFGGITDLLLEHKKSGAPGRLCRFRQRRQRPRLARRAGQGGAGDVRRRRPRCSTTPPTSSGPTLLSHDRALGARNCLIDLQRLCSYGHFRLSEHMLDPRTAFGARRGAFGLRHHPHAAARRRERPLRRSVRLA